MRVSTLQILLLADSQVLLFFLTHGMESEFPVPIFGIRLTKTSLSLPVCVYYQESPFDKSELKYFDETVECFPSFFCVFVHAGIFQYLAEDFSDFLFQNMIDIVCADVGV